MRINNIHDALAFYPRYDAYWNSEDLAATESNIQSSLPQDLDKRTLPEFCEIMTQLAHVQALRGHLPEAKTSLDLVAPKLPGPALAHSPNFELRWTLEFGRWLGLSMNQSKANDQFSKAWKLATGSQQHFFAIDAALMLSSIRPPRAQNEWLKNALSIAEPSADTNAKLWLVHLLFLQGWHHFDHRQFKTALDVFNHGLNAMDNDSSAFHYQSLMWSKARTLRALDSTEEALEIQSTLLSRMTATGKVNGYVYLEMAECKQALNANEQAKGFFELAHAMLSADLWFSDNRRDELERMKYLFKKR